jgi:hypothetical protein
MQDIILLFYIAKYIFAYKDTRQMSNAMNASKKNGRPKSKQPLRNFRFKSDVDEFLVLEKERTGRDMTMIVEIALRSIARLKPNVRDQEALAVLRQEKSVG